MLLACINLLTASAQNIPGWSLVWSDEFTQLDGSAPDSTKWGYDTGAGGWGNSELQTYTTSTNNARIEGGQLVIEARTDGSSYTSARLLTKGKWSWTYGRIEGRIKMPQGQGIWPAFWMMGTNTASVGWPHCGEIDIMENIGSETNIVHATIHGPGYSGGSGIGGPTHLTGAAFADAFHVFAVEWEANRLRWFMDGQPYFTVCPTNLPNSNNWVFTQPQFLLLNLAVGGNWPGNPNGSTTFPQRMIVDYIRVYTRSKVDACAVPPTIKNLSRDSSTPLVHPASKLSFQASSVCAANTHTFMLIKNSPSGGAWPILASVLGDDTIKSMADPMTVHRRFYQVVVQ